MMVIKTYHPLPIRTLDFGIKGGQTLAEMTINTTPQRDG
jgi:hypothetical protein